MGFTLGGCGTMSCIPSILGTASGVCENDDDEPCGGCVVVSGLAASVLDASDCVREAAASRARYEASVSMSLNRVSLLSK